MELKLLELKRYAIDRRVEIKFGDSGHDFVINDRGLLKALSEDKTVRVEGVLSAAETFEISGPGKPQRLSRSEMAQAISEAFKGRGAAAAAHDEE